MLSGSMTSIASMYENNSDSNSWFICTVSSISTSVSVLLFIFCEPCRGLLSIYGHISLLNFISNFSTEASLFTVTPITSSKYSSKFTSSFLRYLIFDSSNFGLRWVLLGYQLLLINHKCCKLHLSTSYRHQLWKTLRRQCDLDSIFDQSQFNGLMSPRILSFSSNFALSNSKCKHISLLQPKD